MKIISCNIDESYDSLYCPSTDEFIFAPDYDEINEDAEAFIAYWHSTVFEAPVITDGKLESSWDKYFEKGNEDQENLDLWEAAEKFLKQYKNRN